MQILKNRHLILAMIIAPILAVIAWFAVDYKVSEKPHTAIPGKSYKLAAKSNCRYQSGLCTLENGDIKIEIEANRIQGNLVAFKLLSELPIQHAVISSITDGNETGPVVMQAATKSHDSVDATLSIASPEKTQLRLAINISGSTYYVETSAIFIDYETSFSRDNFSGNSE